MEDVSSNSYRRQWQWQCVRSVAYLCLTRQLLLVFLERTASCLLFENGLKICVAAVKLQWKSRRSKTRYLL
jgi:hypothetical protein